MNILVVDDEKLILADLLKAIRACAPDADIRSFENADDALAHSASSPQDVAFLDIELPGMSGLHLAQELKKINNRVNVVFVTGYSEYAPNAFSMHASGYVLKPIKAEHIRRELANLRYPPEDPVGAAAKRIKIRCFGDFEVFVDGRRLKLSRSKSRELLAYLVHRNGANVTKAEMASVLWESKPYTRAIQQQLQRAISTLEKIFADAGVEELLNRRWGAISVDTAQFESDYIDLMRGDENARNSFRGEYMAEYSWAESTTADLVRLSRKG